MVLDLWGKWCVRVGVVVVVEPLSVACAERKA